MKTLFSLFLFVISLSAFGQNYECLQPGVINYFINGNGYLRGIRIDSVRTTGDTTVYFPYQTQRVSDVGSGTQLTDTVHKGSWLGQRVLQLSDGTFIFDDLWNDSVIIKTRASVGDSWIFYSDSSSRYYKATVIGTDTMTVLSSVDSVKRIMINAYDSSGLVSYDPLDSFVIVLSKSSGFVQVFDLYTFPYHKPGEVYAPGLDFFLDRSTCTYSTVNSSFGNPPDTNVTIFRLVNFLNPNDEELNNWDSGDVFESRYYYYGITPGPYSYLDDTVTGKIISGTTVNYVQSGSFRSCYSMNPYWVIGPMPTCPLINDSGSYSFSNYSHSVAGLSFIPERISALGGFQYVFYFPNDTGYCYSAPSYVTVLNDYPSNLSAHNQVLMYKLGIGRTCIDIYDALFGGLHVQLNYCNYHGVGCGDYYLIPNRINPISLPSKQVQISPNPASNEITMRTYFSGQCDVSIVNSIGQVVKSFQADLQSETIDVSNLPIGVYLVNIRDEAGNRYNEKLVIEH